MAQKKARYQQLYLDGFGTLLQSEGAPEDVLERARALGHVALMLARRSPLMAEVVAVEDHRAPRAADEPVDRVAVA